MSRFQSLDQVESARAHHCDPDHYRVCELCAAFGCADCLSLYSLPDENGAEPLEICEDCKELDVRVNAAFYPKPEVAK